MITKLRNVVSLFIGIIPASRVKNILLNRLGHRIMPDAKVGICLLWKAGRIELAAGAAIRNFNMVRNIKKISLGENASIGSWNWISAASEFAEPTPEAGCVVLGDESGLTSRHYIDCSGGVIIGSFATVGGHRSTILSHGIDFATNRQTAKCVYIGDWTFVSTGCTFLKGSVLPDRSVLAAGGVLTESKSTQSPEGLFGGVPAKRIKDISGEYFLRKKGFVS